MKVDFCRVDGVDWLSSGRSFAEETTPIVRQQLAAEYDQRVKSWKRRMQIAEEIIQQRLGSCWLYLLPAVDALIYLLDWGHYD